MKTVTIFLLTISRIVCLVVPATPPAAAAIKKWKKLAKQ
jgi:hypothetical protein